MILIAFTQLLMLLYKFVVKKIYFKPETVSLFLTVNQIHMYLCKNYLFNTQRYYTD